MGYYSNTIYPWILDNTEPKEMPFLGQVNLKDVKGEILEIGIGTGANISFYPKQIKKITAIEPLVCYEPTDTKKAINNQINVDWFRGIGEKLPYSDNSFDSLVSTGLLCSVEDVNSKKSLFIYVVTINHQRQIRINFA